MGGAAAKRKLKRIKRQGDESKTIIENISGILMAHGIVVNFPWEIPEIIGELLANRSASPPNHLGQQQAVASTQGAIQRLRALTQVPSSPAPQSPPAHHVAATAPASVQPISDPWGTAADDIGQAAPQSAPPAPPVDPWGDAADLDFDFDSEPAAATQAYPEQATPVDPNTGLTMEQMQAMVEAGQSRMMQRVETTGVQYKNGAQGPAAGKRIAPAPRIAAKAGTTAGAAGAPPIAPQTAPAAMGIPPAKPGERRGKNGLTAAQARALISRATGREVKPPGANPNVKPPT